MRIENLRFRVIKIPFRTVFSHANATRSEAEGIWVEAYSVRGASGCGEGCPRDYVTGETVRSARAFFDTHRPELEERIRDLASLRDWVSEKRREIDANPAAWCAIELALLAVMAEEQGLPVEALMIEIVAGEFYRAGPACGRLEMFGKKGIIANRIFRLFRIWISHLYQPGFDTDIRDDVVEPVGQVFPQQVLFPVGAALGQRRRMQRHTPATMRGQRQHGLTFKGGAGTVVFVKTDKQQRRRAVLCEGAPTSPNDHLDLDGLRLAVFINVIKRGRREIAIRGFARPAQCLEIEGNRQFQYRMAVEEQCIRTSSAGEQCAGKAQQ